MIRAKLALTLAVAATTLGCGQSAERDDASRTAISPSDADLEMTVLSLMFTEVKPATDTLWAVGNPQTNDEWRKLADAASTTIAAFQQVKLGGAGPNDATWVEEPRWQAYSDDAIAAAEKALVAITDRNLGALREAGDELYAPCESCHIDFHPGMPEEDYSRWWSPSTETYASAYSQLGH